MGAVTDLPGNMSTLARRIHLDSSVGDCASSDLKDPTRHKFLRSGISERG